MTLRENIGGRLHSANIWPILSTHSLNPCLVTRHPKAIIYCNQFWLPKSKALAMISDNLLPVNVLMESIKSKELVLISPVLLLLVLVHFLIWATMRRLSLTILDIDTCIQNRIIPTKDRVTCTLPSLYIDWAKRGYPAYKLEDSPSGQCILQAQKGYKVRIR